MLMSSISLGVHHAVACFSPGRLNARSGGIVKMLVISDFVCG